MSNTNNTSNDETLTIWFTEMVFRDLSNISRLQELKKSHLNIIEVVYDLTNESNEKLKIKYREEHHNQLRQLTELYYKINKYLPLMKKLMDKKWNKYMIAVYEKIQEQYNTIYSYYLDELMKPRTNEEKIIVRILLEEMQDVENMLILLLPKKYNSKHLVRCVTEDYYKIRKSKNHILFVYDE